jgi:hypothetical protein
MAGLRAMGLREARIEEGEGRAGGRENSAW